MTSSNRRSPVGAMALGGAVTVVCSLPVFLAGALAVQVMEDLSFGIAALGVVVAAWRASGAVSSPFLGSLSDRLGAIQSIRVATAISATCSLGIVLTADRWGVLIGWMVFGGFGNALGQPAANRLLSDAVPTSRLGIAFGVKQSAPPAASTLAGVSVPLIAVVFGWRWAYAAAATLAALVGLSAGRRAPKAERAGRVKQDAGVGSRQLVLILAGSFGLGTATSAAVTTFYVDASVRNGLSPESAGTMLATASVTAIGVRIVSGVASDRIVAGHLRLCAALLMLGSVGIAILATETPGGMTVGVLLALAGSWGFNGVFWYAMIRAFPRSPGTITGLLAPGALVGATIGPIAFGAVAESFRYQPAWIMMSVVAFVASVAMMYANRRLGGPQPVAKA